MNRWLRELGGRVAKAPPLAILALGWIVLVVYANPGQMTQDSYDHLREAREGVWTDAHPPTMVLLWKVADYLIAGPFAMLVFQVTLFVAGLYLVFRRTFAPRRAAWATTGLLVFPPVMAPMAVIWKDAPMAGLLLVGAMLLGAERRRVRIAGLVLLGAATAVRYNAFGATPPLIVLLFEWRPGMTWLRRYALAAGVWLATTIAAFAFNAAITDQRMHFWHSSLALFDIVGTVAMADDLPDAELRRALEGTEPRVQQGIQAAMRRRYEPDSFLPIVMGDGALWQVPINGYVPAPEPQRDAIQRAYLEIVPGHLGAYLRHRLAVMAEVLCLTEPRPASAIRTRTVAFPDYHQSLGLGLGWSKLQQKLTRWLLAVWRATPLFVPWVYAVIALLLLPLAWRHRDVLALLASGLGLELSLLPLAQSADYRYSHWMIVCTCLAVIVLSVRRARGFGIEEARVPPEAQRVLDGARRG